MWNSRLVCLLKFTSCSSFSQSFWWELWYYSSICPSSSNALILWLLSIFSLFFFFCSLSMRCIHVRFLYALRLVLIFLVLQFDASHWFWKVIDCYYLKYFFFLILSSPLGILTVYIGHLLYNIFWYWPNVLGCSVLIFLFIFPYLLVWGVSADLSSSSLILSLTMSSWLMVLSKAMLLLIT
jgi:hypothetical protein